ncbi:MAG: response regulator [Myxococcaceae bacterium]
MRAVRGVLFIDYVKMLRGIGAHESAQLKPEDVAFFGGHLDPMAWYPMESFERFGVLLLDQLVGTETDSIRLWGRSMIARMLRRFPQLKAGKGPRGAIEMMRQLLNELFQYECVVVESVSDTGASVRVRYGMNPRAEDAAVWQTMGFFEELLTSNGAHNALGARVDGGFTLKWAAEEEDARERIVRPRVLVVDDERLVLLGVSRLLEADAFVVAVGSASEALKKLEAESFDAVLSDHSMPEMTGLELLSVVAARWPNVRRVLHSGNPPADAIEHVTTGKVHELLQKPAPYDLLLRAVSTRVR